jgi:mannan endo-1,4-beta-mannosidase
VDAVNSNGSTSTTKYLMVEEFGVANSSTDNFNTQVSVFNDNGLPWTYWEVIPGLDQTQSGAPSSCGYDGYEIGLNSTKGNVKGAIQAANAATANQSWSGFEP